MKLSISDRSSLLGNLSTRGRVTGKERTVKVRFVFYNGKFYVSRRTADGDWLRNILNNPSVVVQVDEQRIKGHAKIVKDGKLSRQISKLKYPDKHKEENRIVIEITPKR